MRSVAWALALLTALFAGSGALAASPPATPAASQPRLLATLEPTNATVGDIVKVVLTVEGAREARLEASGWGERWGEAEIVASGAEIGPQPGALVVRLRAFRTGTLELPPRPVSVRWSGGDHQVSTPAGLALDIRSVLPPAEGGPVKPKPAEPPVALPVGVRFWWTLAVAAATILALCSWLALRQRLRRDVVAVPRQPPLAALLAALAAINPARIQAASTATSAALRFFLRDTLGIPAPESTTSEIRQAFHLHALDRRLAADVLDLLRDLDGVKFASRPATETDVERWIGAARSLAVQIDSAVLERPEAREAAA